MESRLGVKNCADMYAFAKRHCFRELQDVAFALIARRFEEVSGTAGFLNLNKDDLIDVISADELLVSIPRGLRACLVA